MKLSAPIIALFLLTTTPVMAQMSNNPNVPITQLPNGGQVQATDKFHVARCNYAGCDYQVTPGPLGSATIPLSTTLGGTGLSTVGPNGTVLTSDGTSLSYQAGGGGGLPPGGLAFQCLRKDSTGANNIWGNCLGSPFTSSPSGAGIVTQSALNLVTQSGLNIVPQ